MKRMAYVLVAVLLILGIVTMTNAAVNKYAQAGMTFLKLDGSARAAAMGSASTATIMDAGAMFHNIAGLAQVSGFDVSLAQTSWIADIKHLSAGLAYGHPTWGTFGVSVIKMDYGMMQEAFPYIDGRTDPQYFEQGYVLGREFEPDEYAIGVSYARQVSSQFSFGGQIKIVHQDLFESLIEHELLGQITVENTQSIRAFDFGTLYYTGWKDLRISMAARNFSSQGKYVTQNFELPLNFNIGAAMDVLSILRDNPQQKLTLALDWQHPRDYSERVHFGAEFALMDMLFLRGGYKFNYDEEGLTAGVGLDKAFGGYGVKFDYAYGDFGDFFGSVHRVSLGLYMK
jgi:hypothetical protein